ncbi:MAG TPA: hypothetical protein VK859_17715, partial [bacterium]|nr:hypothetical protein [bacterium]
DGAVKVGSSPVNGAFRLTSKNSEPSFSTGSAQRAWTPYNNGMGAANAWSILETGLNNNFNFAASKYVGYDSSQGIGVSNLNVNFPGGWVVNPDGSQTQISNVTETILQDVNSFTLLPSDNLTLPMVTGGWFSGPFAYQYQLGTLVSPFFYQDSSDPQNPKELAFFVQPSMMQKTIVTWDGWALNFNLGSVLNSTDYWNQVKVSNQVPSLGPLTSPDPESLYPVLSQVDLVTNPAAVVSFNTGLVSQAGGVLPAPDGTLRSLANADLSLSLNPAVLQGAAAPSTAFSNQKP